MSSDYDATEFIDGDYQAQKLPASAIPAGAGSLQRAPTREEVDTRLAEKQQEKTELKRLLEQKEREAAEWEETRRRQSEFQAGRQEMVQHLTRGLGLLEEAEFSTRRDAEQMAKAVEGLRDALSKVQALNEETWTREGFQVELTRALTTLENARMEWNSARLKFAVLNNSQPEHQAGPAGSEAPIRSLFVTYSFSDLCRLGFALTWPLAAVAVIVMLVIVLRK
jgi:hypothetical protein